MKINKISAPFKALIIGLLLTITTSGYASDRPTPIQGFNWYNEKPEPEKKKDTDTKQPSNPTASKEPELPEYEKNIRLLQERHEKAHRQALDNPTAENILAELRLEKEMMRKSEVYGERRVAVALLDSQFTNMKEHSNILHKKVQEEVDAKEIGQKLSKLIKYSNYILTNY